MLDRDEIIRRIISGDMSRGGADFAARMMQQTMPASQLSADARNAQIAQIVRQGQERARMLALEPNLMGPEDELPSQADLDQRFRDQQALPYILPGRQPADFGAGIGMDSAPTMPGVDVPPQMPPQVGLGAPEVEQSPGPMWTRDDLMPLPDQPFAPNMLPPEPTVGVYNPETSSVPRGQAPVPQTAPGFEFMSGGIGMPEDMPVADINSLMFPGATGQTGTPLASPQAGLPTPPGPMMLPAVTPPGGGGGTGGIAAGTVDLANLPSAADVSPLNPEAYNPETGTRPPEARALSIWDRMFGEVGSDQRAAVSQGLIRMGAAMMQSKGDLGQALGEGIEAGLLEFDATTKALADEAKEAKQMGMEEEAHELNMALKRLQLARAQSGGGGGGGGARTSGVVENPFESKASDFAAWSALLDTDPRFAGLNPEVKNRIALNQSGFITAGSIMNGQNPDPLAAYLE